MEIRFEPGMMPHHTIVRAMGMVAAGNPFGTVPFIRITMSVVLPMLPHMHDDELKIAACFSKRNISNFNFIFLIWKFVF